MGSSWQSTLRVSPFFLFLLLLHPPTVAHSIRLLAHKERESNSLNHPPTYPFRKRRPDSHQVGYPHSYPARRRRLLSSGPRYVSLAHPPINPPTHPFPPIQPLVAYRSSTFQSPPPPLPFCEYSSSPTHPPTHLLSTQRSMWVRMRVSSSLLRCTQASSCGRTRRWDLSLLYLLWCTPR